MDNIAAIKAEIMVPLADDDVLDRCDGLQSAKLEHIMPVITKQRSETIKCPQQYPHN